jgi:hypothetical protein
LNRPASRIGHRILGNFEFGLTRIVEKRTHGLVNGLRDAGDGEAENSNGEIIGDDPIHWNSAHYRQIHELRFAIMGKRKRLGWKGKALDVSAGYAALAALPKCKERRIVLV